MINASQKIFPYESLKKYTTSIIQCPLCHYYLKIDPQTDSMKYRLLSNHQIHFLTIHRFNSTYHSVVVEYLNFTFSRIVNYSDELKKEDSKDFFPLYHLVNIDEYTTFRDRILELESNNNELISSFKGKLDTLEATYKQTGDENTLLKDLIEELQDLRNNYEKELTDKLVELDTLKFKINDSFLKQQTQREKIKELEDQISTIKKEKSKIEKENSGLKIQLEEERNEIDDREKKSMTESSDEKLMDLLSQERHQKREALKEKKQLEEQLSQLEKNLVLVENKFSFEQELKDKALKNLQNLKEQSEHTLTLDYEKKISELTLTLQDREEQLSLLHNAKDQASKRSSTKFDKMYREQIAQLFTKIQRQFNTLQYDILLSFYDSAQLDNQIRNAFEKFFGQLIQKTNAIGKVLLSDNEFSLFQDPKELNPRLRFSEEQQQASLQLKALDMVLSELLVYVFAIIKSMKAEAEGDNFVIIPDDADISTIITTQLLDDKIEFHIPSNEKINLDALGSAIRIFRPTSELYKNSFIFITKENDSTLSNNNYQLLPFEFKRTDKEWIIQIENFYLEKDHFQLGSFYENQYFIIQKIDFQKEFNFLRDLAEKNKLHFDN